MELEIIRQEDKEVADLIEKELSEGRKKNWKRGEYKLLQEEL